MTVGAVAHPCQASASWFAQLVDREGAESAVMAVAKAAPEDAEAFYGRRPRPPEDTAGALLGVSVDGPGVPLLRQEAATLTAMWGTGEQRQTQKDARGGVSSTVELNPRAPEAARTRRQRDHLTDDAPRAQQVRRVASLVRTKPQVMALIKAAAARRDPPHHKPLVVLLDGALGLWSLATTLVQPWTRVTCVLDILHVVGALGAAANARFGEASTAGKPWGPQPLTAMLRGRVGDVIGGLRQILTQPRLRQSVQQTLTHVMTFFHHHRRWMPYDVYLAAGLPVGTGVVESACGSVVKPRMAGDGKRWSLHGAEAMLAWRSLKKSHDPDLRTYGWFRAHQVRPRLDGRPPQYRPTARLRRVAYLDVKWSRSGLKWL